MSDEMMEWPGGAQVHESAYVDEGATLGKGTRGPIPFVLSLEAGDLQVRPQAPLSWTLRLRPAATP